MIVTVQTPLRRLVAPVLAILFCGVLAATPRLVQAQAAQPPAVADAAPVGPVAVGAVVVRPGATSRC